MSTISKVPEQWVDKPWPLLTTPQGEGYDINSHYSVYVATDMCHVHNLFIRGLNSIYLQAPYVTKHQDIADLLFYTKTLIECINAHHDGEEKYLFPDLAAYTGEEDIMKVNSEQHEAFHEGMQDLLTYCTSTKPENFSNTKFQDIIDAFGGPLYTHLTDEIATLLALKKYPSEDLKPIWKRADKHINDVGSFDEMFPLAFGCIDKGFEGGKHKFPPVPGVVNLVVKYWFARKHRGAWRFCPCDFSGKPRALEFLPG